MKQTTSPNTNEKIVDNKHAGKYINVIRIKIGVHMFLSTIRTSVTIITNFRFKTEIRSIVKFLT